MKQGNVSLSTPQSTVRSIPVNCAEKPLCSNMFSSAQSLSHVQLFVISWAAAQQAFLSITNTQGLLKRMSIKLVMPSNHLIVIVPFSSGLQTFPASRSFPMSQFFASGGQSIRVSVSASVLPMYIQD